jgi:spore germination cell wall hydrolase CwlJ-like protein
MKKSSRKIRTETMSLVASALLLFAANQPLPADSQEISARYDKYSLAQEYKKQKDYQKEKTCLTAALYHEARGEGSHGIKAVASVIENRKKHEAYPATYCKIIKQNKQFSFIAEGKPLVNAEKLAKPSEREVVASISEIAEKMLQGRFKPVLSSDVLWYTTTNITARWSKDMKKVAVIGGHKFFAKA